MNHIRQSYAMKTPQTPIFELEQKLNLKMNPIEHYRLLLHELIRFPFLSIEWGSTVPFVQLQVNSPGNGMEIPNSKGIYHIRLNIDKGILLLHKCQRV